MLDVCVRTLRGMELWRRATGVVTWRFGALEGAAGVQTSQCRGIEIWSSGGMIRAWEIASKEVWRCVAGLGTWRYRGMEMWSSGGMRKPGDAEV